jgi:hypothetical protein
MRQKLVYSAHWVGRQTLEHILEVLSIRVVSVELGRLDQAHNGGSTLTGAKRPGEQPVGSAQSHRPDPVFEMIVVNWQLAIIEVTDQRRPTS